MKKKVLGLLCAIFASQSTFGVEVGEPVVTLTRRECEDLKAFFMYGYHKNESYLERLDTFTVDYWFDLISRHIQVLENKIEQKKSGWQSMGVLKGLGWVAGTALGGWFTYAQNRTLSAGSFYSIEISDYQMNNIASLKFSRAEKKKFKRWTDAMNVDGKLLKRQFSPYWYKKLNDLSQENYNKIEYLALRLASREAIKGMLVGLGMSAVCLGAAAYQFYKVTCYAERLVERLERDKCALELLQKQKDIRLGKFYSQ